MNLAKAQTRNVLVAGEFNNLASVPSSKVNTNLADLTYWLHRSGILQDTLDTTLKRLILAPIADENFLATFLHAMHITSVGRPPKWDSCGVDLMDVQVWTRLRYIVQNMRGWREQYNVSASVSQVLVFEGLGDAQDDLGHGWVRSWWFPRLRAAICDRSCEITEDFFGTGVEVAQREQQIWPVPCDRLVGAMCSIERQAIVSIEVVERAIHRV